MAKKNCNFFFTVLKGEEMKSVHSTKIILYSNYLILQFISFSSTYPKNKLCMFSGNCILGIACSPSTLL